jgi:hypothetical protein
MYGTRINITYETKNQKSGTGHQLLAIFLTKEKYSV